MVELADVFRRFADSYLSAYGATMPSWHRRAIDDILDPSPSRVRRDFGPARRNTPEIDAWNRQVEARRRARKEVR